VPDLNALHDLSAACTQHLADLEDQGRRRVLREIEAVEGPYVFVRGRRLCSFCSNNYLGLAGHPQITAAVKAAIDRWGWGAGASRLVSGHTREHALLEAKLAAFKRTEAALVFSTGYAANLAAIRAVAGQGDAVFVDKLDHASIIDGARTCGATLRVYPHCDLHKLERLLAGAGEARRRVIITDSLFSMDGDVADLPRLVELKRRYDAVLVIDEAHATGVLGAEGRGLAELQGVEGQIDVVVGTLSKALGGIGGFVAGSAELIEYLLNTAGAFIYTTGLPPAACAAATAALELVEREPERRRRLLALSERVRQVLGVGCSVSGKGDTEPAPAGSGADGLEKRAAEADGLGRFAGGNVVTPIIPFVVGDAREAVALSKRLEEAGLLVPAIRPPTVPQGTARLRISICADHADEDVERLFAALKAIAGE
jgi:8-amino-7-oxononanoate synthase